MEAPTYLKQIINPLIKHPDYFRVVETQDAMGVLLTVSVHQEDMGVIIGKLGETAKSIRHLVRIVGMIGGARVSVKVAEPLKK